MVNVGGQASGRARPSWTSSFKSVPTSLSGLRVGDKARSPHGHGNRIVSPAGGIFPINVFELGRSDFFDNFFESSVDRDIDDVAERMICDPDGPAARFVGKEDVMEVSDYPYRVFNGCHAMEWLQENVETIKSKSDAVDFLQNMLDAGHIISISGDSSAHFDSGSEVVYTTLKEHLREAMVYIATTLP